MTLNGLVCADVPLRNYSLTHLLFTNTDVVFILALIVPSHCLFFYHTNQTLFTVYGTGWPIMC